MDEQYQNENTLNHQMREAEREKLKDTKSWKANLQLIVVIAFLIGAFLISTMMGGEPEEKISEQKIREPLVETIAVTPSSQNITFTKTGTVQVRSDISIVPQVSGRVISVSENLREGSVFEKNEPLFQIEKADYDNQLQMAKAEVSQSWAALELARADADAARAEWQGLNGDRPIPALVARKPQLNQANANLKAAKARVADAELGLKRTSYTYPFNGRVVESLIEEGQFLQAGQSYGRVYQKDALEILIPVEDSILQWVKPNETNANIKTMYRGQLQNIPAKIERIGGELNTQTRFANLIAVPLGNEWEKLLPGTFVEITIEGPRIDNIMNIPNEAIQGQNGVWIVKDDNIVTYKELDILSTEPEYTLANAGAKTITLIKGLVKGVDEGMKIRRAKDDTTQVEQHIKNTPLSIEPQDTPDMQESIE